MKKLQEMGSMMEYSYCDALDTLLLSKEERKFSEENDIAIAFVVNEDTYLPYQTEIKVVCGYKFENIYFNLRGCNSATEEIDDFYFKDSRIKITASKAIIPLVCEGEKEREGVALSASVPYAKFPLVLSREEDDKFTEGIAFYLHKKPEMNKPNKVSKPNDNTSLDYLCKESK